MINFFVSESQCESVSKKVFLNNLNIVKKVG